MNGTDSLLIVWEPVEVIIQAWRPYHKKSVDMFNSEVDLYLTKARYM